MSRDGGSHLPLCPGRRSPGRRLRQELPRRLTSSARPAAGLRFSRLLTGSFTGLTWNGVGLSEARKRLLRTARIDGNGWTTRSAPEQSQPPTRLECFWIPLRHAHILQAGQGALIGAIFDE